MGMSATSSLLGRATAPSQGWSRIDACNRTTLLIRECMLCVVWIMLTTAYHDHTAGRQVVRFGFRVWHPGPEVVHLPKCNN